MSFWPPNSVRRWSDASLEAQGEQFDGSDPKDEDCKCHWIVFEQNTHDHLPVWPHRVNVLKSTLLRAFTRPNACKDRTIKDARARTLTNLFQNFPG